MIKNIQHSLYAILFQTLGFLITSSLVPGAVFASGFFIGRELAQAENRYVKKHHNGNRPADMRWWKALTLDMWSIDSFFWDMLLPIGITIILILVY